MKKVLVYGDSNVWGDNFLTGERIPDDKQWVKILQNKLKNEYIFFQEGLPGRIAGSEEQEKNIKMEKIILYQHLERLLLLILLLLL